jgi:hypothetical protein
MSMLGFRGQGFVGQRGTGTLRTPARNNQSRSSVCPLDFTKRSETVFKKVRQKRQKPPCCSLPPPRDSRLPGLAEGAFAGLMGGAAGKCAS